MEAWLSQFWLKCSFQNTKQSPSPVWRGAMLSYSPIAWELSIFTKGFLWVHVFFSLFEILPNSFVEFKNVTNASSWVRSNRSNVQFLFFFLIIPFVRKLQKSVFSFWNVLCFLFCLIYTGHKRAWKVCDVDAQGQEVFFPLWAKQRLLWRQTAFIAWPHLIRVCLPDLAPGDLIAHSCALSNPRCSAFLPHTCTKASSLPSQGCRFWRQITSSTAIKM